MGPTFQKIEPVSKKTRLVETLKDAIIAGTIRTGEPIVESKMAAQFGVGQGLIREALFELEYRGFVRRTPFSGTHVPKLSLEDALQIFDLRIELEPLAVALAGAKLTPNRLEDLHEFAEKSRQAAETQDLRGFSEHHLLFRRRLWEFSENKYLQETLERLVMPLFALYIHTIARSPNRAPILPSVTDCVSHQDQLLEFLRAGQPAEASRVAREFLVRTKQFLHRLPQPEP